MGSTRLPGKVLKPLGESVVLDYVVQRCREIRVDEVIVATSTLDQDDHIVTWCKENNVAYYRGSEDDVLSRYVECARLHSPDYVIRVTSDCPFVDYEMANEMVDLVKKQPADYVTIKGNLPRGLAVELFSWSSIQYIDKYGKKPRHREHVTYYGYEFHNEFHYNEFEASHDVLKPELRITLDTLEDYQLCQKVAEHFQGNMRISAKEVVQYLSEHPEVANINAHIEQKPVD